MLPLPPKVETSSASIDNVRVNTVLPGAVKTQRRLNILKRDAETNQISIKTAEQNHVTSKRISRLGTPGDIGNVVRFLLSPEAEWIHGASMDVDGGETKGI